MKREREIPKRERELVRGGEREQADESKEERWRRNERVRRKKIDIRE